MNHFKVTEEFKKNPELKEEDLIHLKEWLSKQPHLPHVTGMYFQITNNKWLLILLGRLYPTFWHLLAKNN